VEISNKENYFKVEFCSKRETLHFKGNECVLQATNEFLSIYGLKNFCFDARTSQIG